MTVDALQVIHLCFTGATVLGGLVLGYFKLRNKRADKDEDKLEKFMLQVDTKISQHIEEDFSKHKEMSDKLDHQADMLLQQSNSIAVLIERSEHAKEMLDELRKR